MSHTLLSSPAFNTVNSLRSVLAKVSATIDAAIVHVHNFFAQGVEERLREEEDADLAEATDRYDLEFRMRKQDRLRGGSYWSNGNNR